MKITLEEIKRMINEELQEPAMPTLSKAPTEESLSKKIFKVFSDFNYKLNNYENQLIRLYQSNLNKILKGQRVIINASIGYGQAKKEYTIIVKEVQIIFYYKEYTVVLIGRSQGDRKDREYVLDDSFDVRTVSADVLPKKEIQPEPEQPVAPKIGSPKTPIPGTQNPAMKQSKGPSPSLSSNSPAANIQPKM